MTMGCRDIRETISACVDGEASPEEAAMVRAHLASCKRCGALERQMRAVGAGVRQVRGPVPDRFREEVFSRLESEGALPNRKKVFRTAWLRAALPLAAAAAAALGFFLLTPGDGIRERAAPPATTARMESPGSSAPLTTEDRELIALLDLLEDPSSFDADDAEGMELLVPGNSGDSRDPARGGRSGA
jgi:anti-sigma factor RsiW